MSEIEALSTDAGEDLSIFSRYLHQQRIRHRVTESAGRQIVLVGNLEDKNSVRTLYEDMRSGRVSLTEQRSNAPAVASSRGSDYGRLMASLRRAKVVSAGIFLSLLGALLVEFDRNGVLLHLFTYYDFVQQPGGLVNLPLQQSLAKGEIWRIVTPIFLHFGLLHIAFNMLWFWEFGRRIETRLGSGFLLSLVFVLGVGSNTIQSFFSEGAIFGGMSGVLYGLLGFCWLWDKVNPKAHFDLPPGIVGFMLVWLGLCMTPLVSALGFGEIANAAHLSGLINGALAGAVMGWYFRGHALPNESENP